MRTDRLVELKYSGQPNPTRVLSPEEAAALWRAIDGLAFAVNAVHPCWNCEERSEAIWLLSTGVDDTRRGAIIRGQFVFTNQGTRFDSGSSVKSMLLQFTLAVPVLSSLSWVVPTAKKKATALRCHHKPGHHSGSYDPCSCGSPADARVWRVMDICESSNCYNYAVGDVWCEDNIVPIGATPRAFPTDMYSYEKWAPILAKDGVLRSKPKTAKKGGWHIALATDGSDFHFLRLDGQFWTHKYGQYPPQTCDTAGARIPRNALEKARLCEYQLVGTFYVPGRLEIDT